VDGPPRTPGKRWRKLALFGALALLLLVVCLPWIAAPLAPGFIARAFAERFHGRLEVGGVELSWFGKQALREAVLLDPEGQEVARLSVELPDLWHLVRGAGRDLGTLRAELRAKLVADESGVTNLERALAPRSVAAAPTPESESASSTPGAEPELELELTSPLCSWSDARTRAAGQDFEIRGLRARLALHAGQPARFEAHAELAGEHPGVLEFDAQVDGLRTQGGFAFAKARARGKVQGFSSAMLDGLAAQRGQLEQVLGPRFDLSFELADLGSDSGTLSCGLQSERTHFLIEGRVQDGLLRCTAQRGLSLELGEPRALLESCLEPLLPPGTNLVWSTTQAPWKLECATLALPLPTQATQGSAGWLALLGRAEIDASFTIPGPIGFQNEFTGGINLHPALSGLSCRVVSGGGKPFSATLDAQLIAGETGALHARVQAADPWGPLARGELPVVDARVELQGISNAMLDALIGREAFLAQGFGRALNLRIVLTQMSLAGGALSAELHSANIDLGVRGTVVDGNLVGETGHAIELRFGPPAGWLERQLAPSLPEQVKLRIEPQPVSAVLVNFSMPLAAADLDARLAATQAVYELNLPACSLTLGDGRTLALSDSVVRGSLGRGGPCALRVDTSFLQPCPTRCVLQGEIPGLAGLSRGVLPPLTADLALDLLNTNGLDSWLAAGGRLTALVGDKANLRVRAGQFGLQSGTLELLAHSEKLDARLALACDKGTWRSSGAATDRIALALAQSDLERELGPLLPPATALALAPEAGALALQVRELAWALPADPARPLEGLRAKLELALPDCSFSNALTKQAGIEPRLAGARLDVEIAEQGEVALAFDARIGGAGDARLHAEARGRALTAGSASLRVEGLSCKVVDALIGKPEALSGLLGDALALEGQLVRAESGTGQLSFSLRAPRGEAALAGKLEPGSFLLAEPEGLHVRLEPTDAWLAQALTGLRRAQGAPAPFDLRLHSERIALPRGEQTWIQALGWTEGRLEAKLPDLVWAEKAGAAVELRELVLQANLTQKPGSLLRWNGKIAGDVPGDLACELRALDALSVLGEEGGPGRFRVALHAAAHGVPVGLVDALAGQGGLLVEALGARADLTLESAGLSLDEGAFVLDLVSPQGPAHLDGELRAGVLRVSKPKGLTAHFSLGPLSSTRIVGRLVPLLCELSKPSGAAPASVEVDALALPLDGDLAQLDGLLRFDLGEVNFALLPGLKGLFGSQAAPKAVKLPAFSVPIQRGVVRYEKLVLPLGGRDFAFHGSYSLVDGGLQLGTQIPLELLGSKVSSELDKARGLIDGKTLVPIEIRGTLSKPRFAVGQGFLDEIAKKALGGALEKGLEDLLKKKKKP